MIRFLPLLGLYFLFVLLKAQDALIGDEGRYLQGARNLLEGFFASEETLFLWNGPGYPLYLALVLVAGLSPLAAKLGNAMFLFLAMVRFHGSLTLLREASGAGPGGERFRLLATYALGAFLLLHGSLIEQLMTEALSAYLISAAAWHYLFSLRAQPCSGAARIQTALAGFHLGYLALTKVFFGYALAAGLLASGAWILARVARAAKGRKLSAATGEAPSAAFRAAAACAFGTLLCVPYLAYTWSLTGKAFYWGNSGGSQLYCMTLPEDTLLGDWLNFDAVLEHPDFFPGQAPFYRALAAMDYVRRDEAMKAAALRNLRSHPWKYLRNWRANVNRMVFGYPVSRYPGSDSELRTGNRGVVQALPFYLGAFLAAPAWRLRHRIPSGAWVCLGFALGSLAALSLLSAIPRMVFPLLPLLGLWMAAVAEARRTTQAIKST